MLRDNGKHRNTPISMGERDTRQDPQGRECEEEEAQGIWVGTKGKLLVEKRRTEWRHNGRASRRGSGIYGEQGRGRMKARDI